METIPALNDAAVPPGKRQHKFLAGLGHNASRKFVTTRKGPENQAAKANLASAATHATDGKPRAQGRVRRRSRDLRRLLPAPGAAVSPRRRAVRGSACFSGQSPISNFREALRFRPNTAWRVLCRLFIVR
jgi:hypothetical protein